MAFRKKGKKEKGKVVADAKLTREIDAARLSNAYKAALIDEKLHRLQLQMNQHESQSVMKNISGSGSYLWYDRSNEGEKMFVDSVKQYTKIYSKHEYATVIKFNRLDENNTLSIECTAIYADEFSCEQHLDLGPEIILQHNNNFLDDLARKIAQELDKKVRSRHEEYVANRHEMKLASCMDKAPGAMKKDKWQELMDKALTVHAALGGDNKE
jgi:hypothetical protein